MASKKKQASDHRRAQNERPLISVCMIVKDEEANLDRCLRSLREVADEIIVVDTGSNSIYTITNLRFGRLMDIRLTGGPTHQGLWIQPVSYVGADVRLSRNAPSSGGLLGRLVIAR